MRTNKFLTFEGVDGTGKTTLLKCVQVYLEMKGYQVVTVREPGSSKGGATIREMMFGGKPGIAAMHPGQVDCLMLYDHIGVSQGIIKPGLEQGWWVLCDRYADSQFAYSSVRESSPTLDAAYRAHFGPVPDVTFLLVGDVEEFALRAKHRDAAADAVEPGKQAAKTWAGLEQQRKIQSAYMRDLSGQERTVTLDISGLDACKVAFRTCLALDLVEQGVMPRSIPELLSWVRSGVDRDPTALEKAA